MNITPQVPSLPGMTPLGFPEHPRLRTFATEPEKVKLRKMRTLPSAMKAVIYAGAQSSHSPAVTMQLGQDLQTYGLWEALLYVESYERDGMYKPGTAIAAFLTIRKASKGGLQ